MLNNISQITYGKYIKTDKIGFNEDLKLKAGDTFQGRIIKEDSNSNKVTIRLTNGMEIEAEIQDEAKFKDGLLKFEVMDFKGNKLFIKVTAENSGVEKGENLKVGQDEILNFILKEGLKKEDYNMVKQMLKYNIPLTRENITAIKSMVEFSNKMNNNPEEIESFINNYLNSRNITPNSLEGEVSFNKLQEFFKAFAKEGLEKPLLFLENQVDFSKENIDSYNKLFKSGHNIEKVVSNINDEIEQSISIENKFFNKDLEQVQVNKGTENVFKLNNEVNEKVITEKATAIINILKGKAEAEGSLTKESVKEIIVKQLGQDISLNDSELKKVTESIAKAVIEDKDVNIVKEIINNIVNKQEPEIKNSKFNSLEERMFEISKSISENVEKQSESTKELIRKIVANLKEGRDSTEVFNIMKNNINDLKLYNKISDQYYCLDLPINSNDTEYPCKLIIKDDRKEGKNIDSNNFKVAVSVKTVKLGTVDALLKVKNKNLDVELKCEENIRSILEASQERLKKLIEATGFDVKIKVTERKEDLELSSCREFFNDNNIAALDITV